MAFSYENLIIWKIGLAVKRHFHALCVKITRWPATSHIPFRQRLRGTRDAGVRYTIRAVLVSEWLPLVSTA